MTDYPRFRRLGMRIAAWLDACAMSLGDTPPPYVPPPLPEPYGIPMQLIEAWLKVPLGQYIKPDLSRADWDQLFSAINKLTDAQVHTNNSLLQWTNGNTYLANQEYQESQRSIIESQNALRMFFAAVLSTITKQPTP